MEDSRAAGLPVELIPSDRAQPEALREGMALCLSGGGYRAMLFHAGALWRLNELGWLPRLARVSSVSGGSIAAAVLGESWSRLAFDPASGVAREFEARVLAPIRALAGVTIDRGAILLGALGPGSIGERVAGAYRKHLFGDATLQDLPSDPNEGPRFVFNATNVQSGALFRFSKPYAADWRVGLLPSPRFDLGTVVAASSAFPPFLSPVRLSLEPGALRPEPGNDLHRPPFTTRLVLTDGGVYDNLGLETAWKRHRSVLVSDGGGKMQADPSPAGDWARHSKRILDLIDNQVRSLRKRQLIASYRLPDGDRDHREGTYWGIRSDVRDYHLPALPGYPFDARGCPFERTLALADTPTRLAALDDVLQQRLVNWGYAICDVALRRHVAADLPMPEGFPYPGLGVG